MEYSNQTEQGKHFDIIEQSPEMEVYRNLQALKASYRVFEGNYNELIKYLDHLKEPKKALAHYSYNRRENIELLIDETSRLFHNFLASAKSLVDHTRVIVKRLYSDEHEFSQEYELKKNKDLVNNPVQKFVQNLRNYTQHYTLPIPDLKISFGNDIDLSIKIDVKELQKSYDWGSSKSYLKELGDDLILIDVVNKYHIIIKDFYNWLSERQHNIHEQDLENLKKMYY